MIDMQLRTSELLSLSQRLIPKRLALAFGIATDDEHHEEEQQLDNVGRVSLHGNQRDSKGPSSPLKRQGTADTGADSRPVASGGQQPASSQQAISAPLPAASQPYATAAMPYTTASAHQHDAAAMAHAAASIQAAALAQQAAASMQTTSAMAHAQAAAAAAASMQTTSGPSDGYPSHQGAAVSAAPAAAALGGYTGYPAAVGHGYYAGHPLMPYMQATPQAMAAMSSMSGSLGCAPMSMYSTGHEPYHMMQQRQDEQMTRAVKRPRLVWTPELHKLFEKAVLKLGVDKAVPKSIMQMMKVEGLTRENVASHLQKYRLSLKQTPADNTDGKLTTPVDTSAEGNDTSAEGNNTSGDNAAAEGISGSDLPARQDAGSPNGTASAGGGGVGVAGVETGGGAAAVAEGEGQRQDYYSVADDDGDVSSRRGAASPVGEGAGLTAAAPPATAAAAADDMETDKPQH